MSRSAGRRLSCSRQNIQKDIVGQMLGEGAGDPVATPTRETAHRCAESFTQSCSRETSRSGEASQISRKRCAATSTLEIAANPPVRVGMKEGYAAKTAVAGPRLVIQKLIPTAFFLRKLARIAHRILREENNDCGEVSTPVDRWPRGHRATSSGMDLPHNQEDGKAKPQTQRKILCVIWTEHPGAVSSSKLLSPGRPPRSGWAGHTSDALTLLLYCCTSGCVLLLARMLQDEVTIFTTDATVIYCDDKCR